MSPCRPVRHLRPLDAAVVTALALAGCLAPLGPAAAAPLKLCYQQLLGQAGSQDIEQLRLQSEGARVSGSYRWIPWQKDRRVGRLEGTLTSPGTARVTYRFMQEGEVSTAPLTIVFDERIARISWDTPATAAPNTAQPMPPVQLPRLACGQLKAVPGL
jgi:hypothetical protein